MNFDPKPIEAYGYHFRSQLEYRWFNFFRCFAPCLYEPRLFKIPHRWYNKKLDCWLDELWYRPDFYLPSYGWWIEIKADRPIEDLEAIKAWGLQKQTDQRVLVINKPCLLPYRGEHIGIELPSKEVFTFGEKGNKLQVLHLKWFVDKPKLFLNSYTSKLKEAYYATKGAL